MGESEVLKILFVCSMNQWRSPTAEKIYADEARVIARSCGTSKKARRPISTRDLRWADMVLVMEQKHKQRLQAEFPREMQFMETHVLDIPDHYKYMDAPLIDELRACIEPILESKAG